MPPASVGAPVSQGGQSNRITMPPGSEVGAALDPGARRTFRGHFSRRPTIHISCARRSTASPKRTARFARRRSARSRRRRSNARAACRRSSSIGTARSWDASAASRASAARCFRPTKRVGSLLIGTGELAESLAAFGAYIRDAGARTDRLLPLDGVEEVDIRDRAGMLLSTRVVLHDPVELSLVYLASAEASGVAAKKIIEEQLRL